MRKLRFDLLLLAAAVALFLPARAQAQWFRICAWSTWSNTCSVVTAQAYKEDPGDPWKLRITWRNVSLEGLEGENSVGTRMLVNVRERGDPNNPLFSEDLSVWSSDPPEAGSEWDNWELSTKTKGKNKDPYPFPKLGFEGWTGDINNTGNKGDGGSCYGVITTYNTDLPGCGGGSDHRTLWVGLITFGDVKPVLENVAVQHQRVYSPDCPDSDPHCESGWAVVPEPITMVLVGTGLAGMGGVAALRRRRANELEKV